MLERDVQSRVVTFARRREVQAHKFSSEARRNVPDYVFFYDGRTYFIEFKATGKKARAGQMKEIKKLRDAGFQVDVVDDPDDGRQRIKEFIEDAFI